MSRTESFAARGGWWVVAQFVLFGAILLALTRNQDPPVGLRIAGWVLVLLGAAAAGAGLWVIRHRLTAMPAPLDDAVLRRVGPYAFVRHPIYGGLILGFVGLAIKGNNLLALAFSIGLIPFFYAKTSVEERLLLERFPEYAEYRDQVRFRMLPWFL